MKTCYIFAAGDRTPLLFSPQKEDFLIAADGGLSYMESLSLAPDLILGDFDSLGFVPQNAEVFPTEKDDTDMGLAVKKALAMGFRRFYLYGGLGGRLDHTLSNLQTLQMIAEKGAAGFLVGESTVITAVHNGAIKLKPLEKGTVSVFTLSGEAGGVTLKGLKYETDAITLSPTEPLGVSNELIGKEAEISVSNGTLIVIAPWQAF